MRYYQNIEIDDEDQPAEYGSRKGSAFYNEGKWQNFIAPLLPPDPQDRTFIDIGCNAGLFLRLATEYGFGRVVGVEADPGNVAMAERYRDAHGLDYRVLCRTVGVDFDWDELPVADVVLLSCVHYYIPMCEFLPFLDRMFWKCIDCIVVSRQMREKKHGYPLPDEEYLRLYFRDWTCQRVVPTSSRMLEGDPAPRRQFSLLFRSRLQRQPIGEHARVGYPYQKQQELIDIVRSGEDVDLTATLNHAYWVQRKQTAKQGRRDIRWSDEEVLAHVQYRLAFTRDLMENGMREPVLVRPDGCGIDGGNRAATLYLLGHKSIIARVV